MTVWVLSILADEMEISWEDIGYYSTKELAKKELAKLKQKESYYSIREYDITEVEVQED